MQTLVFNTTRKTVKIYEGLTPKDGLLIYNLEQVPTVKPIEGYYEVMQKDEFEKSMPVLRLPISNTNMVISK